MSDPYHDDVEYCMRKAKLTASTPGKFVARKDHTGKRVGKLLVICLAGRSETTGKIYWNCACACGKTVQVVSSVLSSGRIKSCGCDRKGINLKHGHGRDRTQAYRAWAAAKTRCGNPKYAHYHRYGGRGITICQRWLNSFANFLADMGSPPSKKHQLDRIDNDGNYEPGNCRWATRKQQARNRADNRKITLDGERLTVADWADRSGVAASVIFNRFWRLGWEAAEAVWIKPSKTHRNKGRNGIRSKARRVCA